MNNDVVVADGVHWGIAALAALSMHVAGLAWLGQAPQRLVFEPHRFRDEMVVMLGPGSGAATELVALIEEPRETVDLPPNPEVMDSVDSVETMESTTEEPVPPLTDREREPETASSIAAEDALRRPHPLTADVVMQTAEIVEVQTAEPDDSRVAPTTTTVPLVDGLVEATDVASVPAQTLDPETAVTEVVSDTAQTGRPGGVQLAPPVLSVVAGSAIAAAETVSTPVPIARTRAPQLTAISPTPVAAGAEISATTTDVQLADSDDVAALSAPIAAGVQTPVLIVQQVSAPDSGADDQAAVVATEQNIRDAPLANLVLELEVVMAVTVSEQVTAVDQAAVVIEAPAAPPRVVTLDDMQRSGGADVIANYAVRLKGWLQENMHYPRAARFAGQQGKAVVRFIIARGGKVRSIELEQASGYAILDREAIEMIERADPFPAMPTGMTGGQLELRVPIAFKITDESVIRQMPPIDLE